jgi:hypothetical protein
MKTSEQITDIAGALAKAQGAIAPAVKDSENAAFKHGTKVSKYADLAAVWGACRKPLADNALAVLQEVCRAEGGVAVTTRITHASGQWIEFEPLTVPVSKNDAHGVGSATTYGRRFSLSAALGIVADDDDDGNGAAGKKTDTRDPIPANDPPHEKSPPGITAAKAGVTMWVRELQACGDTDSFEAILSSNDFKKMVAEIYTKFPSEWAGPEQYSGLRGQIEFVGKQLGAEATAQSYLVKVEKALRQKEAA